MATLQNLNFNPLSIATCSLWVDASDRTSLGLAGTNVNQWNDKSGNARNLTTTAGTVTYLNNSLVFPSASIMSGPSMSFSGSIFIVAQPTGNTGSLNHFIGPTGGGLAIRYDSTYKLPNPGNDSDIGFGGVYIVNGTQITVVNPALNTQNNIIYTPIVNGFTGTFTISTTFLSRYFIGNMYEMIIYTTALTAAQRQQVEGYLAWKWGLVANLPASHPYKLVAPNAAGLSYPSALTVPIPRQSFTPSSTPLVFGFSPTSISGCILWLDGMDSNSVTLSGSNVTVWKDKSTAANNVTTVTGTPTYTSSGINLSRTSSDLMRTTNSISFATGATTIFYVAQVQTVGGLQDFMAFPDAGSVAVRYNNGLLATVGDANDFGNNIYYVNGTFNPTITTTSTYTSRHLVSAQNQYISGSTRATLSDSFASRYTSGTYNEVIFFSAPLSTAQRQLVEGYLAWKWGISASLPANHPYKNIVPGLTFNVPIPLYALQGTSFSPRSLSGLSLWLDATDTSTISLTGSAVNQWNDKSGNSRNLTPSGTVTYSTNKLTFPSGSIMTGPSMSFNGSIFLVLRISAGTGGENMIIGQAGADKSIRYDASFKLNNPGNSNDIGSGGAYIVNGTQITITNPALNTQNNIIYTPIINGFTGTFSISNTYGSSTRVFIGDMFEVIMYTAALSTNQRQTVEGYLAWKWGLVANLPATHPWKKFPPSPS